MRYVVGWCVENRGRVLLLTLGLFALSIVLFRFVPQQSEYCWAYQLIARGARMIRDMEAYGMVLLPEFRDWPLPELREAIDREFFLLSEAHYERYIAPRFLREGMEVRV